MDEHTITPGVSLREEQGKDITFQQIAPDFELEKFGIGVDEIKADAERMANLAEQDTNQFPVEVFPLLVQQIIASTNKNLNFPIDFIGASMLYAAAVAIGNTHRAEVNAKFYESAALYLAIVSPSGTNKTHPLNFATHPIQERDGRAYRDYECEFRDYEKAASLSKSERDKQGIDEPQKPVWKKFLLSDFTPEALARVHKFNPRGIGVKADELASWFKNFNRYSRGSEMEFWNSVWSGLPINIDRVTSEPVFVKMPCISVAGTIQDGILPELAKDGRALNGFIERILFVYPDNIKKQYWSRTKLDAGVIENWDGIISNLLNLPLQTDNDLTPQPAILEFTPEAMASLADWQIMNTNQCNEPKNAAVRGVYSKMEDNAVRFALILELMRYACKESNKQAISIAAVEGAIKLAEYFKKSASKAFSILVNPLRNLPMDKLNLYRELPGRFTTGEGWDIAREMGISERTYKRCLENESIYIHLSHGEYEKRVFRDW